MTLKEVEEATYLLALVEGILVGQNSGVAFHIALKKVTALNDEVFIMVPDVGEISEHNAL